MKQYLIAFFAGYCLISASYAHMDFDHWLHDSQNSIQLGGTVNTGNSPSRDATGKFLSELDVEYPDEPWGYTFSLSGQLSTARGVELKVLCHSCLVYLK